MTNFEFKDEQLIGFLLGALDKQENELIAKRLLLDPDLAARLVELQSDVLAFDAASGLFSPDSDNEHVSDAESLTCEYTPEVNVVSNLSDASVAEADCSENEPYLSETSDKASETSNVSSSRSGLIERTFALIDRSQRTCWLSGGMSEVDARDRESAPGRGNWFDLLAISAVLFIAFSLLVPSVYYSRQASRQMRCADNLRSLGFAFGQYSVKSSGHFLPGFSGNDPMAFAGCYAIELNDAGLLEGRSQLNCTNYRIEFAFEGLPRTEQFLSMCEGRQKYWQRVAGGTYAFNAGFVNGDQFQPVRMQGRSHFAILSDLPLLLATFGNDVSCNSKDRPSSELDVSAVPWDVHGNGGLNILFEDGRVQYVGAKSNHFMLKNLFLNSEGRQDIGLNEDDCVLLPSHYRPKQFRNQE